MSETSLRSIREFLALKRIAVAGASRNPNDFNAQLFRDLLKLGYDAVPVNPQASDIGGVPCYESVGKIDPPVEGVLVMTRPAQAEQIVGECHTAGIRKVWLYRAAGEGAVSPATVDFCRRNGMDVVAGECPYMFLKGAPWYHKIHGVVLKIIGRYPA
ncbi:MAG TPA: CoA-binding protein [Bryobacteraceae bacterium]